MRKDRRPNDRLNEVPHVPDHVDETGGRPRERPADIDDARPIRPLPEVIRRRRDAGQDHRLTRRVNEPHRDNSRCRRRAPGDRKDRPPPAPPPGAANHEIRKPAAQQAGNPREELRCAAHHFGFVE